MGSATMGGRANLSPVNGHRSAAEPRRSPRGATTAQSERNSPRGKDMRQELFRIFGIPVYGYGTLVLIGVLTGLWLLSRNARRRGWNPQVAQDCAVYLVIGGLLGGRTFHFIQYHDTYESPLQFFALWKGGLVLYGALLGGLGMGLFLAFRRGLPVLAFLDLLAPVGDCRDRVWAFGLSHEWLLLGT